MKNEQNFRGHRVYAWVNAPSAEELGRAVCSNETCELVLQEKTLMPDGQVVTGGERHCMVAVESMDFEDMDEELPIALMMRVASEPETAMFIDGFMVGEGFLLNLRYNAEKQLGVLERCSWTKMKCLCCPSDIPDDEYGERQRDAFLKAIGFDQ